MRARFLVGTAILAVASIVASVDTAVVPLPRGVVAGRIITYLTSDTSTTYFGTVFNDVRIVGPVLVGGQRLHVVASARRIQYESTQCHHVGCVPTRPTLAAPFDLVGKTTLGRDAFAATCTAGDISNPLADQDISIGSMVSAFCDGGTATVQGSFAFRFLLVGDVPLLLLQTLSAVPFVAPLVEA